MRTASAYERPALDLTARARPRETAISLTYRTMGALGVRIVTMPGETPEELLASLRTGQKSGSPPTLELCPAGLLTDTRLERP